MLQTLRTRLEKDEEGFTLIELMVVVLIIAILLAIAIPTFLGARNRANDRAAQSSLRNALTGAKTIFTDQQDYSFADATTLAANEPSLTFVAGGVTSSKAKIVSVDSPAAGGALIATWEAATYSASGTCFYIKDVAATGGGTFFNKAVTASTACMGTAASGASSATSW